MYFITVLQMKSMPL